MPDIAFGPKGTATPDGGIVKIGRGSCRSWTLLRRIDGIYVEIKIVKSYFRIKG
jgi:hypothetical protein